MSEPNLTSVHALVVEALEQLPAAMFGSPTPAYPANLKAIATAVVKVLPVDERHHTFLMYSSFGRYEEQHHVRGRTCGGCGVDVTKTAITQLAYVFDVCACGTPEYAHLLEVLWHRDCLANQLPTEGGADEGTTSQGCSGDETAVNVRAGADSREVGTVVPEAPPASEEGGAGEPSAGAPPRSEVGADS